MSTNATKVITPTATLSYPHLDIPQKDDKGKLKYSCCLVFAPGSDLSKLEAAVFAAAEEKFPGKGREMLVKQILKSPFRKDAAAKNYPDGSIFVNVRTEQKPGCVYPYADPQTKKPARVPDEKVKEVFYPGAQVLASLRAFTYDVSGNKGVSFALNNVQFIGDGKRLDSRVDAVDEFEADLNAAPADISSLL